MSNNIKIARELVRIAKSLVAVKIIPRTILFDDDKAIINSFLSHRNDLKSVTVTYDEKEENLIVTFSNGYKLLATAVNKEHAYEELYPLYTADKNGGTVSIEDGYAYFNSKDIREFDTLDEALEFLFGNK